MPILRAQEITRQTLKRHPDWLFLFGDNLAGTGFGGQAAAMRGEPNAVGITTKRYPSMEEHAFLTDDDYDEVVSGWGVALSRVCDHLSAGGTVVIPEAGLGTERAQLAQRAPEIAAALERTLKTLEENYGSKLERS